MRILLFYILFALLSQQTTDNGQQTLSTFVAPCTDTLNVSSHIICDMDVCDTSLHGDSLTYYESQIRLADSLYKNYLPQYNFDEVKKAVAFFERTTDNSQQTTDFVHKNKPQQLSNSASYARAHYYHAVGLTERDDIVGACEHYLRALEIMEIELETENQKTSKSERRLKSNDKRLKKNLKTSELKKNDSDTAYPKMLTVVRCLLTIQRITKKIRFLSLIYTRLGELFLSENYCDLAISKYRKALKYVLLLGENKAVANTYKCLGNSYQLYNMPDSALYYYKVVGDQLRTSKQIGCREMHSPDSI